jgi:hypothetical protein
MRFFTARLLQEGMEWRDEEGGRVLLFVRGFLDRGIRVC